MPARSSPLEFFSQESPSSCAPACLRTVAHAFGLTRSEAELRTLCRTDELGTYIEDLCAAANALGLQAEIANRAAVGASTSTLEIAYVNRLPLDGVDAVHCVVVESVNEIEIEVLDPLVGARTLTRIAWDDGRQMVGELLIELSRSTLP